MWRRDKSNDFAGDQSKIPRTSSPKLLYHTVYAIPSPDITCQCHFNSIGFNKVITLGPSRNLDMCLAQILNHHQVLVWNTNINFIEIQASYFLSFVIVLVYCGYKSSIDRISYGYNLLSKRLSIPVWFNLINFTRTDNYSRLCLNISHF
jgi:hypothetical protein